MRRRRPSRRRTDRRWPLRGAGSSGAVKTPSGAAKSSARVAKPSSSVVEDDAERVPVARAQPAHTVAHRDPIAPARAAYGPMAHGEDDTVALVERHDLGAGLHARPLLGQDEFAAGEVTARRREKHGGLQRKEVLAVDVLVQAVV